VRNAFALSLLFVGIVVGLFVRFDVGLGIAFSGVLLGSPKMLAKFQERRPKRGSL